MQTKRRRAHSALACFLVDIKSEKQGTIGEANFGIALKANGKIPRSSCEKLNW